MATVAFMPTPPLSTLFALATALFRGARIEIAPPEGPDSRIRCGVWIGRDLVSVGHAADVDGAVAEALTELRWFAKLQAAQLRSRASEDPWYAARAAELERRAA
jgi:hypothetical protein